ncbi:MAG TPA: hypothetical protein VHO29_00520 [Marmoricola sp.]|nr:hypothetical protein [Marmoricola sp.]
MNARRFVSFRTGWIFVGVGVGAGMVAAFLLFTAVGPAFRDALVKSPCATPCAQVFDLDAGHYLVFEEVGRSTSVGPFSSTTETPPTISPADVTVTSSSGRTLAVGEPSSSQTIDRNGVLYGGVVSFEVPQSGRYRLTVDAPPGRRILVAPGLGQTFLRALPGVGVAVVGFVVGLTGAVLVILAWSRRRTEAARTRT